MAGLESVIFLVVFIPLRRSAGGYHAITYAVRFWLPNVFMALSFCFIKWARVVIPSPCLLLIAVACLAFLWICAPVKDSNKPLDAMARKVNGRRTKIITSIYISAIILFVLLELHTLAATIISVILLSSIIIILGLARNKIISK